MSAKRTTLGWWLAAFVGSQAMCILLNVYAVVDHSIVEYSDFEMGPLDWVSLASTLCAIVAGVLALRWIHASAARAQRLADGLRMTPGWNVGWYFVPVAHLWKPFEGFREIWAVSHDPGGRDPGGRTATGLPPLLRWWWGAWLAATMLAPMSAAIAARLETDAALPIDAYLVINIVVSILWMSASGLLWRVVTRLSCAQATAMIRSTFA